MMLEKMEKEYPGVDLKKEDIDMCHRLVQSHDGKPRPVIVQLVSRLVKQRLMKRRRELKGKTVTLTRIYCSLTVSW